MPCLRMLKLCHSLFGLYLTHTDVCLSYSITLALGIFKACFDDLSDTKAVFTLIRIQSGMEPRPDSIRIKITQFDPYPIHTVGSIEARSRIAHIEAAPAHVPRTLKKMAGLTALLRCLRLSVLCVPCMLSGDVQKRECCFNMW